jgi:hypothetical protein
MRQLARRSRSDVWDSAWPELATFDCYACHHSLQLPSWRQARGYTGTPGYPPLNDSRFRVFRQIVSQVSSDSRPSLEQKMDQLRDLLNHASGRRTEFAETATEIATLADQLARQLAGMKFDERVTRALLRAVSSDTRIGYDSGIRSAEQAAMTLDTLYATYSKVVTVPNHNEIKAAINRLYDHLQDPARFDPAQFAAHMQAVHRLFQ